MDRSYIIQVGRKTGFLAPFHPLYQRFRVQTLFAPRKKIKAMEIRRWIKSSSLSLLSLFTEYDSVCQAIEAPTFGAEILMKRLIYRNRKAMDMLVPTTMWNIYRGENVSVTWGFCIIFVLKQNLERLSDELLLDQIRTLGPIAFSLVYSIPMTAVYIYYHGEIMRSTESKTLAFSQAALLLFPELLYIAYRIRGMYNGISGRSPSFKLRRTFNPPKIGNS
ncbi:hypothetical protein GALMADRAFT_208650 [Galerina marginata CBS 339.88]|uniref:Uncharacterized protein n=1 Tax=Galerina marginata (strain CBS 339.88) TaxID=685588 RepID=A0A067T7L3_GALM3|nr:hypothetical protein GALMADRAFT_208650 [Galerina marginata CBS 339.88]